MKVTKRFIVGTNNFVFINFKDFSNYSWRAKGLLK